MLLKILQGDTFQYRGLSTAVMQVAGVDKVSLQSQDWTTSAMVSAGFSKEQDAKGFSSSLPLLFQEKLKVTTNVGDKYSGIDGGTMDDALEALNEGIVSLAISDLLPDDEDELLAGIDGGFDCLAVNSSMDENDDFDLFSSGGGLEMDGEVQECFGMFVKNPRVIDGYIGNGIHGSLNGPGSMIGEHPYGEHPSRTLFVRNINSNVEDSELRTLFEHYGDIRTLYTACKHRGFVMISYYDIRAARSAMRALQNKPLRRRKLDIHFSIPKDNPSDKDVNQGTLVVFNLDASVSNDDLRQIFSQYGEVKEIRETPHKRHHKFIEFYDVRGADAALRALNRSNIAGKRIKLEPSRPGGARRSLMQQLTHELEQDEVRPFWQQSSPPVTESPPGHTSGWGHFESPVENGLRSLPHSVRMSKPLPGLPIPPLSSSLRAGTIGSHLGRNKPNGSIGMKDVHTKHPHSLPEYDAPLYNSSSHAAGPLSCHGMHNATEGFRIQRTTSGNDASLFVIGTQGGSLSRLNSGSGRSASLSGSQFLWGSSSPCQHSSPVVWSNPPMSHSLNVVGHTGLHGHFVNHVLPAHRPYAGSDPSAGDAPFLERQLGYLRESPDTRAFGPGSPISARVHGTYTNGGIHDAVGSANFRTLGGLESGALSLNMSMMPSQHRSQSFYPAPGLSLMENADMIADRVRIRRVEGSLDQADGKKQYELDIGRILHGEDRRTTLMIKNIPNKYSAKMLCATIDESHRGMYDFFYLPIDFKNKCNVGYAFINMTSPDHIVGLHKVLNGKKWEKFNSEKVASLAYARIQGKAALVAHFQNSSLMNEDKRCRPILIQHGELGNGEVEHVPLGVNITRDQQENGDTLGMNCNIAKSSVSNAGGMVPGSPEE